MSITWTVIHNPKASSGKGAKKWPGIAVLLREAGISFTAVETARPGHAISITQDAIRQGARHFIAVGGDGTANEVANGILSQTEVDSRDIRLAQIPIGTGNDWGRTVGIPAQVKAAIDLLKSAPEIVQDVGLVQWEENGQARKRYFINIAGIGYDAYVGKVANERKAAGKGGLLGYFGAVVSCLFQYKAPEITFSLDGEAQPPQKVFYMLVGICRYNGAGMLHCPDAIYDDGLFDLTVIGDMSVFRALTALPRLFNGSFVKLKQVRQYRGKHIKIESQPIALVEVDGENLGELPAHFSIEHKRLRVIGQPKRPTNR